MITLAIDRYDRHFPFFDGTVPLPHDLQDLKVLQAGPTSALRDGAERHERLLRDREFDAAETSLASYLVARANGLPFTAIPVFPRRLFSQGQIFVNADAGIGTPADLAGRTIGLQSFQTTLAVLAKGDLASDYEVPLASIGWRVKSDDTVETNYPPGFDIAPLSPDVDLVDALCSGEIDALFYSRTPSPPAEHKDKIRRLFADPRAEEMRYIKKNGYWPIMHVVALLDDTVAARPALPALLMTAFNTWPTRTGRGSPGRNTLWKTKTLRLARRYGHPGWRQTAKTWTGLSAMPPIRGLSAAEWTPPRCFILP
jgi:4,5-dihydroxyphthalate decarboxylase